MLILTRASRGEVIITQKEAKGEYGSGWEWTDVADIHAFDSASTSGRGPRRMLNNSATSGYCEGDVATTSGDILVSGSQMIEQESCNPHTGNVGNFYNWYAAAAGGEVLGDYMMNSLCPEGWSLTKNDDRNALMNVATLYANDPTDVSAIAESPISLIRTTWYDYRNGKPSEAFSSSRYWAGGKITSSRNVYRYLFSSSQLGLGQAEMQYGYSVRCVAR